MYVLETILWIVSEVFSLVKAYRYSKVSKISMLYSDHERRKNFVNTTLPEDDLTY